MSDDKNNGLPPWLRQATSARTEELRAALDGEKEFGRASLPAARSWTSGPPPPTFKRAPNYRQLPPREMAAATPAPLPAEPVAPVVEDQTSPEGVSGDVSPAGRTDHLPDPHHLEDFAEDDGINIELTGLPGPAPEPILEESEPEPEEEPSLPSALPVVNDDFSSVPPGSVGELEDSLPPTLLLDDLKRAEFVQRLYNFARTTNLPSDPLSADEWRREAEDVLLYKATKIKEEIESLRGNSGISDDELATIEDQALSNLDPNLAHAINPGQPERKHTKSLAEWLMRFYGLEVFERSQFWSRCFPSSRWVSWREQTTKYKTGFIYEPVPEALLLRKLQEVSEDESFITANGERVGNLSLNKRRDVIEELRHMLDPEGGATRSLFEAGLWSGFATSEEIPKWVEVSPGYEASPRFTIQSRPVEISDKATFVVPCAYDPQADCPNFKRFLDQTFDGAEDKQERIDALLEWIAAAVFGETTRRAKALYLYGYTATGKSVVCELVKLLFPKKNQTALGFEDLENDVSRGELSQSRLNVMGEAAKSGRQKAFGSGIFKSAVSGDEIRCNVKFKKGYKFRPNTAFLFAANGRMPLNDCDDSIFRRLIIIHFQNPVPEADQDPNLINKFRGELSGILNMVLKAAQVMMPKNTLLDPPSSRALKRRWAGQTNSVKAFLDEECSWLPDLWTNKAKYSRKQKHYSTPISQLHRAYRNWCEIDGLKAVGSREFRNRLDGLGIKTKELSDGTRVPVLLDDPDRFTDDLRLMS